MSVLLHETNGICCCVGLFYHCQVAHVFVKEIISKISKNPLLFNLTENTDLSFYFSS